ncbi:MAG: peptidoglycan D,D-transpeptidase FtsI family protein [Acidimicrobiales bacterium]
MNRQIRLAGAGVMALFLALFLQLNYLQVVRASSLNHDPRNGRAVVKEFDAKRGDLVSADGVTLAHSVPSNDKFKYLRQYPQGPLFADVTGFFSFTYGADGAERTYDTTLTGVNAKLQLPTNLSDLRKLLADSDKSQSVTLTLSSKLQAVAADQLRGRVGSVVAINPQTGAILALYSNPTYDPNQLSAHNQQQVQAAYKALGAAPGNPLSPGAYRNRWFPGSTFKIITASSVYDHAPSLATKDYPVNQALSLPDTNLQLHNFGGETCGGLLPQMFTISCNTGFAAVGLDLGAGNLYDEAHSFGFDRIPPVDLPAAAQSAFPPPSAFVRDRPGVAYSAIGQQNVQATPLQMALVASAIADGGTVMVPHVIDHVTDSQGNVVATYQPKPWLNTTSSATAAALTQLMMSVVADPRGTGAAARISGVSVAAKTGTAQTGTGKIDAWFAAFAPVPNPSIAVAVVVPDQPSGDEYQGGTIAAPIAKAVIQAYLASLPPGSVSPSSPTTVPRSPAPVQQPPAPTVPTLPAATVPPANSNTTVTFPTPPTA